MINIRDDAQVTREDHVALIKGGVGKGDLRWGDFGSGDGAFTLALREIIGPQAEIYSIDTNAMRLTVQRRKFDNLYPNSSIHYLNLDFKDDLPIPKLDGIVMANSLHYTFDKVALLQHISYYLRPRGKLIVVEYNSATGNVWVPFPVPFDELSGILKKSGFNKPTLLKTVPSSFLQEIYGAVALHKALPSHLFGNRQVQQG